MNVCRVGPLDENGAFVAASLELVDAEPRPRRIGESSPSSWTTARDQSASPLRGMVFMVTSMRLTSEPDSQIRSLKREEG